MPDHHDPSYRNPFSRRTSYDPLPPGYSWARPIYPGSHVDPSSPDTYSGNRQTSRSRSRQRSTSYRHDPESSNPRRRSSSIIGGLANYLYGTPMPTRSASVRQTRQESTHGTSRRRSSSTRPSPMRSASVRQSRQESTHDTPRRRSSSIRRPSLMPSLMQNLFGSSSTTFRNKTKEEKAAYHREYYAANAERIQARRRGEVTEPKPRAKKAKTPESSPTTRRERSAYYREYYAKNAERINAKRREEVAQGTESAVRRRQAQYARDREHRAQNDEVAQRKREQLKKYQAPEYRDRYNANRRRRRAESSKNNSQEVIQIDSDSD